MPKIKNMGTATMIFKEGLIVSGSAADRSDGYSEYALVVTGSAVFDIRDGSSGDSGGISIIKDESDPVFIRFINDDDPTSWYAYMAMDSAENFYIAPGRSQDFYLITRENSGSNFFFPLRIFDNGKVKFHQAPTTSSDNQVELPSDVVFSVSGSTSGTEGVSVFGGNVIVSGSLSMTGSSGLTSLNVYGNTNGSYVATIDNDENTNGHVLKLSTDGNGSGSRILEMEDGDGDIVFRARADGRFGFGPDGVSSMGAGTFVVGIDNSSHTADIAISQRLQHLGDSNTYLDFPSNDTFNLVAGGNSFLKYDSGNILINNANADVDTKIMADDGNVVLHVDAGTNKVGIGTTSPNTELHVDGSFALKSREVTSFPYSVAADDYVVLVAGTGTPRRINLPAKSGQEGRIIVIKDATGNAQTNNIEINPDGSENIDGSADKLLNTNRVAVTIICASDQWHIIGKYSG